MATLWVCCWCTAKYFFHGWLRDSIAFEKINKIKEKLNKIDFSIDNGEKALYPMFRR
jgi:hypothetical protein